MTLTRLARIFVLGSLAWGTLAFGATYEWASRSLAVLAIVASGFCFAARWHQRPSRSPRLLIIAMMLVLLAIAAQLVPLSRSTIAAHSPQRQQLLEQLDLAYGLNVEVQHPLSINPPLTQWAWLFCGVSFAWILSLSKLLSGTGVKWLARGLAFLGVMIALIGIIQNAVYDGRVYGFWTPESPGAAPFGPFINKNHFAGWMLMVLPLTAGLVSSEARHAFNGIGQKWRDRLIWVASRQANRLLLLGLALLVMSLALVLTLSRSAIATALILTLFVPAAIVARTKGNWVKKTVAVLAPVATTIFLLDWVGLDTLATRFEALGSRDLSLRLGAWSDAIDIAHRFPWAGTGLNTYGTATVILQRHFTNVHFAQAHSDYLQVWAEGGMLLVLPAAVFAIILAIQILRSFRGQPQPDYLRIGAAVGMIAILLQETVDFSLQMPGNLLLFATLCAITIHPCSTKPATRETSDRP